MDKLQLTGQDLGRVFNFRSGHLHAAQFFALSLKLPNLKLKAWPKQLLGFLPLVLVLLTEIIKSLQKVQLMLIWPEGQWQKQSRLS